MDIPSNFDTLISNTCDTIKTAYHMKALSKKNAMKFLSQFIRIMRNESVDRNVKVSVIHSIALKIDRHIDSLVKNILAKLPEDVNLLPEKDRSSLVKLGLLRKGNSPLLQFYPKLVAVESKKTRERKVGFNLKKNTEIHFKKWYGRTWGRYKDGHPNANKTTDLLQLFDQMLNKGIEQPTI